MNRLSFLVFFVLILAFLVACQDRPLPTQIATAEVFLETPSAPDPGVEPGDGEPVQAEPATPSVSPTPEEPLAALVNGEAITLEEYQKELARYEQAQVQLGLRPDDQSTGYANTVLNALIETELIAQAAEDFGISVTPESVETRLVELRELSGGNENFTAWLQANQLTLDEFRIALASEMLTEQTVAAVTADVPTAVEQVHARYIQVDDEALAQSLLEQIRNGADFAILAQQYSLDRVTGDNGGDLGYFAQGSLLVPEVEAAAFALQPSEYSEVIAASRADGVGTTYYLVQVIERDPQRVLTADLLFVRLQARFEQWLAEQRTQAEIIQFVEIGT